MSGFGETNGFEFFLPPLIVGQGVGCNGFLSWFLLFCLLWVVDLLLGLVVGCSGVCVHAVGCWCLWIMCGCRQATTHHRHFFCSLYRHRDLLGSWWIAILQRSNKMMWPTGFVNWIFFFGGGGGFVNFCGLWIWVFVIIRFVKLFLGCRLAVNLLLVLSGDECSCECQSKLVEVAAH